MACAQAVQRRANAVRPYKGTGKTVPPSGIT